MTGPGAVLVGLSIGAGEIIVYPLFTAKFGASICWIAAVGLFLQLCVNIEIGRWTVATGESTYTGYSRIFAGFAYAFILFNVAGWFLPGWARTSGLALKALIFGPDHASPDWLWTAITFLGVGIVLFGSTSIYKMVEHTVEFLVVVILIGLIIIAANIANTENLRELGKGIVSIGYVHEGITTKQFFMLFVFAGAGGTSNLFYSYYLRDKRIGMGARIPQLVNPFRKRTESAVETGYIFTDNDQNRKNFRDWFRFIVVDQTIYFWLLNTLTMFLFIFCALVILHQQGIVPKQGQLIWDESLILGEFMGQAGRYLFLVIGLATLFSTQVALTDGVARSLSDIIYTSIKPARRIPQAKWYFWMCALIIVCGVILTAYMEYRGVSDLGFFLNAAYIGGFAMAVYTPLTLYMNLRYLPRSARPGPFNILMLSIASLIYLGFAVYCIAGELGLVEK